MKPVESDPEPSAQRFPFGSDICPIVCSVSTLVETLLADTERELAEISRLPEPKRFSRLLLLSLEREQIAAVAYSEDLVTARITDLPVEPEVRELISRVVKWTQRDEALHAQYLRGLLVQKRPAVPVPFIMAHQLVGGVSGWVSAVSHHHDAESWGLRRLVSSSAIKLGEIAGRIPDGLAGELTYQGFRRFCLLSVALEMTAILSYEHILNLLSDPDEIDVFSRILADERRHAAVFAILAESFDEEDRIREGVTLESLVDDIRAVSPWFLPAGLRSPQDATDSARRPVKSSFGKGSSVRVDRGQPGSLIPTLIRTIEESGLEDLVRSNPGPVAVRAQFMLGYSREDMSTVVHPEVVEVLAQKLREWGATDVAVIETPMVYDRFFANRSVAEVAEYFGYTSPLYRIVDVSEDERPIDFERGLVASNVSATWADAKLRIVVSKLRGDPAELAHLSLASLCGIGGRTDNHLYTDKMIDHRTAALMALDVAPPDFAIVDAWAPVADGPLGVMGCHKPSDVRRLYAGTDAFSVDAAVFADMGFPDPSASEFVRQADQWFGSTSRPTRVEGEPGPFDGFRTPQATLWFRCVSATAAPIYFHLSGRGRLFVPEVDTQAFPPIDDPTVFVKTVRRAAQKVFGLHPPRSGSPSNPGARRG